MADSVGSHQSPVRHVLPGQAGYCVRINTIPLLASCWASTVILDSSRWSGHLSYLMMTLCQQVEPWGLTPILQTPKYRWVRTTRCKLWWCRRCYMDSKLLPADACWVTPRKYYSKEEILPAIWNIHKHTTDKSKMSDWRQSERVMWAVERWLKWWR